MAPGKKPTRIPISQLADLAVGTVKGRDPRKLPARKATLKAPERLRVIGIDPGSRVTGFGVVELHGNKLQHIDHGIIRAFKPGVTFEDRLVTIHRDLNELILTHKPDAAAVEGVFSHRNARAALKLGQARGVALLSARIQGLEIFEYAPSKIKQAVVGYGAADKDQVNKMIALLLDIPCPKANDASDALAMAICHLHALAPQRLFSSR